MGDKVIFLLATWIDYGAHSQSLIQWVQNVANWVAAGG